MTFIATRGLIQDGHTLDTGVPPWAVGVADRYPTAPDAWQGVIALVAADRWNDVYDMPDAAAAAVHACYDQVILDMQGVDVALPGRVVLFRDSVPMTYYEVREDVTAVP